MEESPKASNLHPKVKKAHLLLYIKERELELNIILFILRVAKQLTLMTKQNE